MRGLVRGAAEPVSRGQSLGREREKIYINFPRSADHVSRDWQLYSVDTYSAGSACHIDYEGCTYCTIYLSRGRLRSFLP